MKTVNKIRAKAKNDLPTLDEITKEVEQERSKKYENQIDRVIIDTNLWISFYDNILRNFDDPLRVSPSDAEGWGRGGGIT
jgi:hypothetical protein